METSRGRWFLNEYASRNRHSDTRTVLDAVERIEATLARQQLARAALSDAVLGGIAEAVGNAKARALEVQAASQTTSTKSGPLAGVTRAAQAIRDVSWTLRECGADTRICDLLDSQTEIIADRCTRAPETPAAAAALAAVFEDLAIELDALVRGDTQATPAPAACDGPAEFEAAGTEPTEEEAAPLMTAAVAETVLGNTVLAETALAETMPADAAFDVSVPAEPSLADSGYDAALIDETPADAANASAVSTATDGVADEADEIAKADMADTPPAPFSPAAPAEPASSRSLGAALVSGGLIDTRARPDPLAALRKMSYAEKIALFS